MPNYCNYSLKIVAKNKNSITLFNKWLDAGYSYGENGVECDEAHHFCRVFSAYDDGCGKNEDDTYYGYFSGDCAWSVSSCMTENGYYRDIRERYPNIHKVITLKQASELLHAKIEVFSCEPGCCFYEHLLYNNGKKLIDTSGDFEEFYLDGYDSKEEYEKEYNIKIPQEVWDNRDSEPNYIKCDIDPYNPEWRI